MYAPQRSISGRNLKDILKSAHEWLQTASVKHGGYDEKGKGAYLKMNTKKRNPEVIGKSEKGIKTCITKKKPNTFRVCIQYMKKFSNYMSKHKEFKLVIIVPNLKLKKMNKLATF